MHTAGGAARLGTTGLDRTLIIAKATAEQLRRPLPRAPAPGLVRAVRTRTDVPLAEVSIIDQTAEELLHLQLCAAQVEYDIRMGAGARFTRAVVKVRDFQVRSAVPVSCMWPAFGLAAKTCQHRKRSRKCADVAQILIVGVVSSTCNLFSQVLAVIHCERLRGKIFEVGT